MRIGIVTLTQGNINNNHLYLTEIMSMFPATAVGGSSEAEAAPQLLEVHSGIGEPVNTDIAGDKRIFRKRTWVGEFFRAHQLKSGDRVVIEQTGPTRFHVYPCREF
jgi:hypothetical protein